jgi:hypothetical protein
MSRLTPKKYADASALIRVGVAVASARSLPANNRSAMLA